MVAIKPLFAAHYCSRRERRFLVIDVLQLILVEPDMRKLGWGVVKFVGLLQVRIICLHTQYICFHMQYMCLHTQYMSAYTVYVCIHSIYVFICSICVCIHSICLHTQYMSAYTVYVSAYTVYVSAYTVYSTAWMSACTVLPSSRTNIYFWIFRSKVHCRVGLMFKKYFPVVWDICREKRNVLQNLKFGGGGFWGFLGGIRPFLWRKHFSLTKFQANTYCSSFLKLCVALAALCSCLVCGRLVRLSVTVAATTSDRCGLVSETEGSCALFLWGQ